MFYSQKPTLELTSSICGTLEKASQATFISDGLRDECVRLVKLASHEDGGRSKSNPDQDIPDVVPIHIIRDVYKSYKDNGQKIYLHEIVDGSKLVLQTPIIPPSDPELVARVKQLKIEEENREYERMTRNVNMMGQKKFTFQDDVKAMNRQLTGVLNFLITVAAGFAFGYKAVEYSFGSNFSMQMMAGLITGTVVFFVDLYFLVKYSPI